MSKHHDNRPSMNISQFKLMAETVYEPSRIPVILWGQTGVGKTDILIDLAKDTDRILRIFYPSGMEPTDTNGMPFPSESNIELVEFRKTDLIHFESDKKYLVFIDELNRAPIDVQQSLVPLWNRRKPMCGVHHIDSDIWIVTAMNDASLQDNVIVQETDDALRTRSAQIILKPNVKEVGKYLLEKYPGNIIAQFMLSAYIGDAIDIDFGNIYQKNDYILATPRNFEMLAQIVQGKSVDEVSEPDFLLALESIIGSTVLAGLQNFINEMERLDPKALFTKDQKIVQQLKDTTKDITQAKVALLVNGFQQALDLVNDKTTEDEIDNFLDNMQLIAATDDGKNAYKDVVSSVYAKVRQNAIRPIMKRMAQEGYIDFFVDHYGHNDTAKSG